MKKIIFKSLVFLLFLTVYFPNYSSAEESKQINAYSLDQIVVTESRTPEKKKYVTSNVVVITKEEIEQSSSKNVGDLLAEKGVGHITKYPGTLATVEIRGFRGDSHGNDLQSHILILIDGHRAGTGNLAKLMTKNVERIEIIRGPGAVQYGSAGMGGVINIITKQGKTNSLDLTVGYGTFDEKEITVGGTLKKNIFDFSGSYTYYKSNDYDTGDGDDYYNTYVGDTSYLSLNGGVEFLKNHRIGVIFNGFKVTKEGNPSYISSNDRDDYDDKSRYSVDFNYKGKLSDFSFLARYFFGQDRNIWFDPANSDPSGWDNGIPYKSYTDQEGAQAQITFDKNNLGFIDKLTLTGGFDWVDYDLKQSSTPEKSSYRDSAIFLLSSIAFLKERVILSFGGRYDWYHVDLKDWGGTKNKNHFTPRIGLAFMITDYLKLRLQYSEGYKMPDASQLAANYTSWGRRYVGNPNLDPEKSKTYEAGLDLSYKGINASFTYFTTDFKDKIESYCISSFVFGGWIICTKSSWKNLGDAEIEGFEFDFSYDLGLLFNTDFEIKPYFNGVKLTRYWDEEDHSKLQYEPNFTSSFGLTISKKDNFYGNINFSYHGKEYIHDWQTGQDRYKGGHTVCNLVLEKNILKNKFGNFTLRGEVRNLFDKEYSYVAGYPMPGRSFFISLNYKY